MAKRDADGVFDFFNDLKYEIESVAGTYASTYAKLATKEIIEEWADEFRAQVHLLDSLSDYTMDRREYRGNPPRPPLKETGELLSYIEFRWTCLPDKPFDMIEVGIFDTAPNLIGHTDDISPKSLAIIHEYGFQGSGYDKNGRAWSISIPPRPLFERTAQAVGFDRIIEDTFNKVKAAKGRDRRSLKAKGQSGTIYGSKTIGSQRKSEGLWGGKAKPPGMIQKTQIGRYDDNMDFYWVNRDVEREYEKGLS